MKKLAPDFNSAMEGRYPRADDLSVEVSFLSEPEKTTLWLRHAANKSRNLAAST